MKKSVLPLKNVEWQGPWHFVGRYDNYIGTAMVLKESRSNMLWVGGGVGRWGEKEE